MTSEEKSSLPDVKSVHVHQCARPLKFQELSFNDNSYHVYVTEVSRTIISNQ